MKPIVSSLLPKSELLRAMNSFRKCYECNHIVRIGNPCAWCSGKVTYPEEKDRKPIPSVFLNPLRVEKVIDVDKYRCPTFEQDLVGELKLKVEEEKKTITKRDMEIDKKAMKEKGLASLYKKEHIIREKKCDAFDICGKMAVLGRRTCSRECTLRVRHGWVEAGGGFKSISDEQIAEKLAKQRGKEVVKRNKI